MTNRIPVSNKGQRIVKQEEHYDKYLLHDNLSTSRSECAIEDWSCPVCKAYFDTEEALLEHQEERKFHCDECKKCFKKEAKYWAHMVHVHPAACDSDSDSSSDPSLLCTSCKFMFPTQVSFDRHVAIIHQTGPVPFEELKVVQDHIQPAVNKFHYCTRCQFTFVRKEDFFTHLVRLHQIDMELDPYPIKVHHPDLVPDFNHPHHFCNACEYTFQNKINFLQHLLKQHAISGLEEQAEVETHVVCCPVCYQEFTQSSEFYEHLKLHRSQPDATIAKNYCSACDKSFYDNFSLKRHLKSVHQIEYEKPKETHTSKGIRRCDTCQITLNSHSAYKRHLESRRHGCILASLKVQSGKVNPQKAKGASKQNQKKLKETVTKLLQQLERKQKPQNVIVSNLLQQLEEHQETEDEQGRESVEQHQPYVSIEQDTPSKPDRNNQPDIYNKDNFCTVCKYKFPRIDKFKRHLIKVHLIPEDQMPVFTCFSKKVKYVTLMTGLDLKGATLRCTLCRESYKSTALYNSHLEHEHREITPLPAYLNVCSPMHQCTACNRVLYSLSTFRSHLETIHGIEFLPLKRPAPKPDINDPDNFCFACKRKYASRLNYLRHLAVVHHIKVPNIKQLAYNGRTPDINDPNNYCAVCEKTYSKRKNYLSHLECLHDIPHDSLVSTANYNQVPDVNNCANTCTACKRTYESERLFLAHLAQVHGNHLPQNNEPISANTSATDNTGPLLDIHAFDNRCNICSKEYHSRRNFRNHMMNDHGYQVPKAEQPAIEDNLPKRKIKKRPSRQRKVFTCDTCQSTYTSASIYQYHLVQAHGAKLQEKKIHLPAWINLDETPDLNGPKNTCTACKRNYSSHYSFRNHLTKIHRMVLPKEPSKLPISERTGGVEPDANDARNWCAACDRVYSSKYNYRAHLILRHRMNLPAYSVKTDPNRENVPPRPPPKTREVQATRKTSRAVKHSCSECDTTFFSERELLIHMKFVHEIEKPASSKRRRTKTVTFNDVSDAGRTHSMHLAVKEEESLSSLDELSSRNEGVLQFK